MTLKLAIVAGEESGDLLGADLVDGLAAATGGSVELIGVGGDNLARRGLQTLFDPGEIALMGITAVLARLPGLIRRIGQTAEAVVAARPDCLVTIDSPDFSLRVASKVRALAPDIPIVHYVCPSVWAWRPRRAPKMVAYVDRVLCILPFEVDALAQLKGPPGTYVGHRLTHDPALSAAARNQKTRRLPDPGEPATVLVLPGSRRGEVSRLLSFFRRTLEMIEERGRPLRLLLPTVPHVSGMVEAETAQWRNRPRILRGTEEKYRAFAEADVALAASGTVLLELALARVPTVSCYRSDALARMLYSMITSWSGALPNLIAGRPVIPEFYDEYLRPSYISRHVEQLIGDTAARAAQMDGFDAVAEAMATDRPASAIAADAVLALARR